MRWVSYRLDPINRRRPPGYCFRQNFLRFEFLAMALFFDCFFIVFRLLYAIP